MAQPEHPDRHVRMKKYQITSLPDILRWTVVELTVTAGVKLDEQVPFTWLFHLAHMCQGHWDNFEFVLIRASKNAMERSESGAMRIDELVAIAGIDPPPMCPVLPSTEELAPIPSGPDDNYLALSSRLHDVMRHALIYLPFAAEMTSMAVAEPPAEDEPVLPTSMTDLFVQPFGANVADMLVRLQTDPNIGILFALREAVQAAFGLCMGRSTCSQAFIDFMRVLSCCPHAAEETAIDGE